MDHNRTAMEGLPVLPSQTARPARRRTLMHHRPRRPRRRRLVIAVLLALPLIFAGFKLWTGFRPAAPEPEPLPAVPAESAAGEQTPEPIGQPALATARIDAAKERMAAAAKPGPPETPPATPPPPQRAAAERTPPPAGRTARPRDTGGPTPPVSVRLMEEALALAEANRPVEARRMLTSVLDGGRLGPGDAAFVRDALESLNRRLVFSPEVVPGDPFARYYVVGPGDRLGGIVKSRGLQVDWRFVLRVNHLPDARSLRAGQRLKLVSGPFHAIVDKSDFRLDLYLGEGPDRVFVASFPVGLGAYDSTPVGSFRVRPGSKLVNPQWTNPRTGEQFDRDDPANPIGEHWIGLAGADDATRDLRGYGIHGTIEPETVGHQASMGCIRMLPGDVELMYEVLTNASRVDILP